MIRVEVFNDGSGAEDVAHYECYLYLPEGSHVVEYYARVEDYDRSLGWAELVRRAVDALERERDPARS